jgi:hypothetical protein
MAESKDFRSVKMQEATAEAAFKPSLPLLAMGGENPLVPLLLSMESCATQEEMNGNVEATLKRGYERINEHLDAYSGTVSIVGAGPSIKQTWKELKGDVIACNSALKFLLDNGVVPKWSMLWDAHPLVATFAEPHPEVTYLVATRCHPSVFERLKDCRVIGWYAGGDHNIAEFMSMRCINEPMINGGSAAVTRGMYLAYALGYRDLHLFGCDSCYSDEGDTHVNGSVVPEKDMRVWVGNGEGNRCFRTTPEWCAQIEEFKMIYANFHNYCGARIEVYGEGMLQHVGRILAQSRMTMEQYLQTQSLEVANASQ